MPSRFLLAPGLLALALIGTSATACVSGAPPGFSDGDLWEVPLVAPLENDLLLVPVSIHDKGPFLFMVDPDSPESSIETSLQSSLNLFTGRAGQRLTEDDHLRPIMRAQVNKMTIGDLSIRQMFVRVHDDGTYWSAGRRVRGILGRDVIADSLIYKFDRDKGMMYIATQGHMKPPEDAKKVKFTQSYGGMRRYPAKVQLNHKHNLSMHLDLGARTSMLWSNLIKKYKMPAVPVQAELVDEYGIRRNVSGGTIAGIVTAGEVETTALTMLPYGDLRVDKDDIDGVLGLNFWNQFNVTVNWHRKGFWLQKRNPDVTADAAERVGRWGDQLDGCQTVACLRPELERLTAPAPATPEPSGPETSASNSSDVPADSSEAPTDSPEAPANDEEPAVAPAPIEATPASASPPVEPQPAALSLVIFRDAPGTDFAYDAVVGAVDANGKLLDMPVFLASFPSGVSSLRVDGLSPEYARADKFVVLDINPVGTRGCEGNQCVYPLRNPQQ